MSTIKIEEVKPRVERFAAHSHIRGLGVRDGKVEFIADGFVGQTEAREAAYIVVKMIKEGKFAGKGVLIVGPPGTGKTALALGIARELGSETPFVAISAGEIYSLEVKKSEFLMRALRRAIGIRVREWRKVYEGEVRSIEFRYGRHPYNPYLQRVLGATIKLRTRDDEKTLRVPAEIAQQLIELEVEEGDIIMIDEETGTVTVAGRGESGEQYDIAVRRRIELPRGPVYKEKEIVRFFTLHDVDMSLARQRGIISAMIFGFAEEVREIPDEVRRQTDEIVKKTIEEGKAELVPGVLFIDDAHLLDIEAFSFLTRAMETEFAPIIIMATNRGFAKIRGTDIEAPHGIPQDMLDRLVIIRTRPYTAEEIREIINIKAREQNISLTEDALKLLTSVGVEHSLRYALQLLIPAYILAKERGKSAVGPEEIEYVRKHFISVKESVEYVKSLEEKFLK
ncbi:TBP-interacting protein TIP49 [Pyrobaculum islandicum DSM 4184]|uniref:DNA helicase n=1 Tax=Pyrobaculum islandicum (strain DSM 4184 / JCM 9189 / GEO3) TaxID=384616 RepID=A1RV63_PYRIL|nr:RuvB-like helicase [Pyrobaculum islandicum]ABL88845.1 TBP-interacting protein TIP49 [Pyrobaculum islandicum DSM 4184]